MSHHYEVRAVISVYAGNHQRELTEWVFGATDEDYEPSMERPHAEAMDWAYDPEGMEGLLEQFVHDEYGMVWSDLWYNPAHSGAASGIYWQLNKAPSDEQWEALKAALASYTPEQESWQTEPEVVNLLSVALVKVITTEEVVRVR